MTLAHVQDFIDRRRSAISILIELSGLAVAAAGLMWIGGMKEKVESLERQVATVALDVKSLNEKVLAAQAPRYVAPAHVTADREVLP